MTGINNLSILTVIFIIYSFFLLHMNFISPQLKIKALKNPETEQKCLYFRFTGKFTEETSKAGSKAWTDYLREHPGENVEFVWDCKDMTGFEISARKEWYNAMQGFKKRIVKTYVISDQIMIRSAAKVMLSFFGIPSEIGRSGMLLPKGISL
ncbi:MAG: hypothetical protein Tsb0034_05210 [Ekhidna sp.]